jgi:hypothetical protein
VLVWQAGVDVRCRVTAKAQASKQSAAKNRNGPYMAHIPFQFNPIQIQFIQIIQILMHTTAPSPTSISTPLTLVSDLAEV